MQNYDSLPSIRVMKVFVRDDGNKVALTWEWKEHRHQLVDVNTMEVLQVLTPEQAQAICWLV